MSHHSPVPVDGFAPSSHAARDGHAHDTSGHHAHAHAATQEADHDHHHHPSPGQSIDTQLLSIGVDIGSATTHFVVSELSIGQRDSRIAGKPEILGRKVVFASRVIMTPYLDPHTIDAAALEAFLRDEAAAANIDLGSIHTGAVVCTGEASRKDNASAISERISAVSGDFVCAAAGNDLEATLGAHGSGAVELSRRLEDPVVLLDIGGGTSKRSILHGGRILQTTAMNIGTRLIAVDEEDTVVRVEPAGAVIAAEAGIGVSVGSRLSAGQRTSVAERMVAHLAALLELVPASRESRNLVLTGALPALPGTYHLALAGGLSDYYFGHSTLDAGDLGRDMSVALRAQLSTAGRSEDVFDPGGGIRATVIGAGQFALQVSGETIFLDGGLIPPLRAIPVRTVTVPWTELSTQSVTAAVATALRPGDTDDVCALAFGRAPRPGYALPRQLAACLGPALAATVPGGKVVLVFEQNIGRTVGHALAASAPQIGFLCLDEIDVGGLDYMDIGPPTQGNGYLPITVKTLAFGA